MSSTLLARFNAVLLVVLAGSGCTSTTLATGGQERSEALALVRQTNQIKSNLASRLAFTEEARVEALTWTSKVASTMYPAASLAESGNVLVIRLGTAAEEIGRAVERLRSLPLQSATGQVYRDQAVSILQAKQEILTRATIKVNNVRLALPTTQQGYYPKQTPEARAALEKLSLSLDSLDAVVRELRLKYQLKDEEMKAAPGKR